MDLFKAIAKADFDQTIKIDGKRVPCYSKKKMKDLYKKGTYTVVGEFCGNKVDSPIGYYDLGNRQAGIVKQGDLSRVVYREAGFVCVGPDQYLILMKNRLPLILWPVGIVAGVGLGTALIVSLLNNETVPDATEMKNPLPSIDPKAQPVTNDGSEDTEPSGGNIIAGAGAEGEEAHAGEVSLMYSLDAALSLGDGKIDMFFVNPHDSDHDIVLELFIISDDGSQVSVAKSGRIPVGMGVTEMEFNKESALLAEGVYDAMYAVYPYNPDTGELSIVDMNVTDVLLRVSN